MEIECVALAYTREWEVCVVLVKHFTLAELDAERARRVWVSESPYWRVPLECRGINETRDEVWRLKGMEERVGQLNEFVVAVDNDRELLAEFRGRVYRVDRDPADTNMNLLLGACK